MDHTDICPACDKAVSFWERDSKLHCSSCGMTKDAAIAYVAAKSLGARIRTGGRAVAPLPQLMQNQASADAGQEANETNRVLAVLGYGVFASCLIMFLAPMAYGAIASGTGTPTWQLMTDLWVSVLVGVVPLAFGVWALHRWLRSEAGGVPAIVVVGLLCAGVGILSGFVAIALWLIAHEGATMFAAMYTIDAIGMAYFVWLATRGVVRRIRSNSESRRSHAEADPIESGHGRSHASKQAISPSADPILLIANLKKLLDIGAITPDEYARKKHEILGRL